MDPYKVKCPKCEQLVDRWAIPRGLSRLEYFAAHAPPKPNGYGTGGVITELQATVQWNWEYAYAMMAGSPRRRAREVFCLEHRKVMTDGTCPKCQA